MLSVPVFNVAGERIGEESIDPADFGGEVNKQLLHDVVLMHLAESPGRHRQHPGPGRRRRLGQEALPPEGHRQRPRRLEADEQAEGRRRRLRPPQPRLLVLAAQEGRPCRHPDGDPLEVPGRPGDRPRRPGPGRQAQDEARRPGPPRDRPARPQGGRGLETTGETKAAARKRTLDGRTILLGIPAHDPVLHRSARNIEGVEVAPVAEFNTYDVLKQRYLVLTREALAALKERVKEKVRRRPEPTAAASPATETQ